MENPPPASSNSSPNWADLPPQLQPSILSRLSVLDFFRLRLVCTSMSSFAPPHDCPLSPHLPYLLLPGPGDDDHHQSEHATILSLPDRRRHRLGPFPVLRGSRLIGSQDGWLALRDSRSNLSLLNPLTRSQIHLPTLTALPKARLILDFHLPDGWLIRLTSPSILGCRFFETERQPPVVRSLQELASTDFVIGKVVTTPNPTADDFAAIAIPDAATDSLLFTRAGHGKWFLFGVEGRGELDVTVKDAIYRDGKFLILGEHGAVHALDPDPSGGPYVEFRRDVLWCRGGGRRYEYLVESAGELLHVGRSMEYYSEGGGEVGVTRLDQRTNRWVGVESLGDRSLFLGSGRSMSLSAWDVPGLRPNCIYFPDGVWDLANPGVCDGSLSDLGEEDGSAGNLRRLPLWFTPSLLA